MAIFPVKPRKIAQTQLRSLAQQSQNRPVGGGFSKSFDENFPVFGLGQWGSFLIYVPRVNSFIDEETEGFVLAETRVHNVKEPGEKYGTSINCTKGIVEVDEDGNQILDGTCPICDAYSEIRPLYDDLLEKKVTERGVSKEDTEAMRPLRAEVNNEFPILYKTTDRVVFPIVVIERAFVASTNGRTKGGFDYVRDENGNLKPKVYWLDLSKYAYEGKGGFQAILTTLNENLADSGIDEYHETPEGLFFTIDTRLGKDENDPAWDKMDAARDYTLTLRDSLPKFSAEEVEKLKAEFDELASEWTADKVYQTVKSAYYIETAALTGVIDKVMESTRVRIATWNAAKVAGDLGGGGQSVLEGLAAGSEQISAGGAEVVGELGAGDFDDDGESELIEDDELDLD